MTEKRSIELKDSRKIRRKISIKKELFNIKSLNNGEVFRKNKLKNKEEQYGEIHIKNMIRIKKYLKYIKLIIADIGYSLVHKIQIYNTDETLKELVNTQRSISRYGDAEISIMLGNDFIYQKYDKRLEIMLKKILRVENENKNHLVAIPHVWMKYKGYTKKSIKFWMTYLANNRKKIYPMLNLGYRYYDSQITRIYINRDNKKKSKEYFDLWKSIWKNKNVLIVEGEYSRLGVGNDILNEAKSIRRIICPPKNAFDYYYEIKESILKIENKDIVLILLGPTATVLAWELSKEKVRAIDLGNLDMEYEWLRMGATNQTKIQGKYTCEAIGGEEVEEIKDKKYMEQIILKIGNQE